MATPYQPTHHTDHQNAGMPGHSGQNDTSPVAVAIIIALFVIAGLVYGYYYKLSRNAPYTQTNTMAAAPATTGTTSNMGNPSAGGPSAGVGNTNSTGATNGSTAPGTMGDVNSPSSSAQPAGAQ